jgi:hypothetical protein
VLQLLALVHSSSSFGLQLRVEQLLVEQLLVEQHQQLQ